MLLRTDILTENCRWVPLFTEHYCQKKTVPSYLKFLNERGGETTVSGSSRKRTRSGHEKSVRNWSWLLGSFSDSRNTKPMCKILKKNIDDGDDDDDNHNLEEETNMLCQ